jgi:cell wall assembly regulator SMI1
MPTTTSLPQIETWLNSNRADYLKELLPGATDGDLDAFGARFQLELPDGFRDLYKWRNGQEPECSSSIAGNRMFMSLAEIARAKESLDRKAGPDPTSWKREWIPFLDDGGGNYTVVDLRAEGRGSLIDYYHDEDFRTVVNKSVDEWLQEVADSMEDGSYEAD